MMENMFDTIIKKEKGKIKSDVDGSSWYMVENPIRRNKQIEKKKKLGTARNKRKEQK